MNIQNEKPKKLKLTNVLKKVKKKIFNEEVENLITYPKIKLIYAQYENKQLFFHFKVYKNFFFDKKMVSLIFTSFN